MSVAILPMSAHYGWSSSVKGAVSSSFNWGHMITNVVGGYAAAVTSPKHVLSVGVVVWSIFTVLTPGAAATRNLPLLLLVRAAMGLGEGVAFPTMQAIIKGWVPADKRSRALSLLFSGHQIGSICSLLISPPLIQHGGLPLLFCVYGSLGFLWLAFWLPWVSSPGLKRSAPGGSKAGAPSGGAAQLRLQEVPWRKFLACRPLWAIAVCHATFGFTYSICIAWLPTYYSEVFSLDVRQSSTLSVLPWAAMALGTNLSGWTADGLVNGKVLSTGKTRKLLQTVGCGGPALALLYLALVPQRGFLGEAVTLLTLAMGLLGFQAAGFAANHQDIASRYASVLFGATNAAASLAGSIGVYAVGVVLDRTSSWPLVLAIVACLNFAAALCFATLATSEPLFE
ncbi:major facilitator superfamily domain-containing protein [Haematococcus lacustris]